jgi:hypothetical protein
MISPATHCRGNPDSVWNSSPALRERSVGSQRFVILSLSFGTKQGLNVGSQEQLAFAWNCCGADRPSTENLSRDPKLNREKD